MSACYKMYSIVQRVYPLTVDSLLSPGTLSVAFVILINYFTPKISNESRQAIKRYSNSITRLENEKSQVSLYQADKCFDSK